MFNCKFCNKECKNNNSLRNHERLCKKNVNRQQSPFENIEVQRNKKKNNQFTSGKVSNHSYATKEKISTSSTGKHHSIQTKKKLSIIAKSNNFGGHTSKKKIWFKKKNGEEIYLQSSYEIKFAELLEASDIEWSRPKPFIWVDDQGEDHRYYPDFKIGNIYIDTKNDYLIKKDLLKIQTVVQQNSIDLRVVSFAQINKEYVNALKT